VFGERDAGDVLPFQLVLDHTGASDGIAYNLSISDSNVIAPGEYDLELLLINLVVPVISSDYRTTGLIATDSRLVLADDSQVDYSVRLDPDVEVADPSQSTAITVTYRTHPDSKYGSSVSIVANPPVQPTWSIAIANIEIAAISDAATQMDEEATIGSRIVYNVTVQLPQGRATDANVRVRAESPNFVIFTRLLSITTSNDTAVTTDLVGSFDAAAIVLVTPTQECRVDLGVVDIDDTSPQSSQYIQLMIETFV